MDRRYRASFMQYLAPVPNIDAEFLSKPFQMLFLDDATDQKKQLLRFVTLLGDKPKCTDW